MSRPWITSALGGCCILAILGCAGLDEVAVQRPPVRECDTKAAIDVIIKVRMGENTDALVGCAVNSQGMKAEMYTADGWLMATLANQYVMVDAMGEPIPTGSFMQKRVQYIGLDHLVWQNGNQELVPYFVVVP